MTFGVRHRGATERARIFAVDDNIAEDVENFTVSIGSTYPPSTIGTDSSQTATIMDSDRKSAGVASVK